MTKSQRANKGGRPPKNIDQEMVDKLASIGCTGDEIAAVLGCCRDTLYARFSDSLKKGQQKAKVTLRRMQWQSATSGNVTMQIWLGKNLLGQSNSNDIPSQAAQVIQVVHYGQNSPEQWVGPNREV